MLFRKPIDWSKPHLRLVYLVEGVFRDPYGGEHFVRWCGPKSRTGSGFVAYATLGDEAHPMGPEKNRLPDAPVSWEARLSGGSYGATLGTLKQSIQALSEVSVTVALGDSDNPTGYTSVEELRDMALEGRWRGQAARLILVDADEIERYEMLVEGTWDRDPTKVGPRRFGMVINAGEIIPPTLPWGVQIPDTTDYFQTFSYTGTDWSPDGSHADSFELNPDHKGRWLGEIFGGATHTGTGAHFLWREIVPYGQGGASTTFIYAWVSPRFDQFCYDVVFESAGGLVKMSALGSNYTMRCFNNNDPLRGPVGTCVMWRQQSGSNFDWYNDGNRAWARVAGGHPVLRPSGYQDIGSGDPELGNNLAASGGECVPLNSSVNPQSDCNAVGTFGDLIQDSHFLGRPDLIHPSALSDLHAKAVTFSLPYRFRVGAVPRDLTEEALPFRAAMEGLMRSIPADLTLRVDPSDGRRKYFAVVRQQLGQSAPFEIKLEDLANADTPANVRQMSDPDGYYSNDTSLRTSEYYNPPITGTTDGDELVRTNHAQKNIVDLLEQSSTRYGIVVEGDSELKWWSQQNSFHEGFDEWAVIVESTMSVPQKVIEATHGYRSMRLELGQIIEYKINGVLPWPGQIRRMKFNLDSQQVAVTSYHLPIQARVDDVGTTVRDKERAVANKDRPAIDRRRD